MFQVNVFIRKWVNNYIIHWREGRHGKNWSCVCNTLETKFGQVMAVMEEKQRPCWKLRQYTIWNRREALKYPANPVASVNRKKVVNVNSGWSCMGTFQSCHRRGWLSKIAEFNLQSRGLQPAKWKDGHRGNSVYKVKDKGAEDRHKMPE